MSKLINVNIIYPETICCTHYLLDILTATICCRIRTLAYSA